MSKRLLVSQAASPRALVASLLSAILVAACGASSHPGQAWTWQGVDLPGQSSGLRSATYDAVCNCLWIVERAIDSSGTPFVKLLRLDVSTGTAITTSMHLPGDGYIGGALAIDLSDRVWIAWGHTLVRYEPVTGSVDSWQVPMDSAPRIDSSNPGLDGNIVAVAADSTGEVWIAAYSMGAVLGFNSKSETFDRSVALAIAPFRGTRLLALRPGTLMIDGFQFTGGSPRPVLADVQIATGTAATLGPLVQDYAITSTGDIVFVDDTGALGRDNPANNAIQLLPGRASIANPPQLTSDKTGNVWFSLVGFGVVGVGELNPTSGAITAFPLPQPKAVEGSGPGISCDPIVGGNCDVSNAAFDPQIQAITIDSHGDLWVVTRLAGSGDPHSMSLMSPVYELKMTS